MPFVRILVSPTTTAADRRSIADAVHDALVRAIGIPVADRFQTISTDERIYDRTYGGVERSDATVFIQIALIRGRTVEQKRALYQLIAENLRAAAGIRPDDAFVTLVENDRIDWSIGHGQPI